MADLWMKGEGVRRRGTQRWSRVLVHVMSVMSVMSGLAFFCIAER